MYRRTPDYDTLELAPDGFVHNPYQGEIGKTLAQGVIDHIRHVPESWNQSVFADEFTHRETIGVQAPICGSAACLAGWTASLHTGVLPRFLNEKGMQDEPTLSGRWFSSEYAAFLLRVDAQAFHEKVYTQTGEPEEAIRAFCQLTGVIDPGWGDEVLERRSIAARCGFYPTIVGVELGRAILAQCEAKPDIWDADEESFASLAGAVATGEGVSRIAEACSDNETVIGALFDHKLAEQMCGYTERDELLDMLADWVAEHSPKEIVNA